MSQGLDPGELPPALVAKVAELALKFQGSSTPGPKTLEEREAEERKVSEAMHRVSRKLMAQFGPRAGTMIGPPDRGE